MNPDHDAGGDGKKVDNLYEFILQLIRKHPRILMACVILIAGFCAYVVVNFDVSIDRGEVSIKAKVMKSQWRGFYVDVGVNMTMRTAFEDLSLRFAESGTVSGRSSGIVQEGGKEIKKKWIQTGFHKGELLFMNFLTIEEEDSTETPVGLGAYVLSRMGVNYSGYTYFRDSKNNKTVSCPYVLIRDTTISLKAAIARWPQLRKPCQVIEFPQV